jgi:hypothetical protein
MTKEIFESRRECGIALVLTLAILVIATILVVGFAASMRTERQAATSLANNETAGLIAQAALNHAVSILERNIPQPIPPGGSTANPTNWIINPGLLTTIQGTAAPIQIPLSSNPSVAYASTNQDAELNVLQTSRSDYTILPTSASMRVAWIPILKDPTTVASATNRITGRYAFWIDDENSRINVNTAYGKPSAVGSYSTLNTSSYIYGVPSFVIPIPAPGGPATVPTSSNPYSLGHPSSISLDVLSGLDRDAMWTDRLQRQIQSPSEISRYATTPANGAALYQQNKFWLTTHSRDPEFNVFGKARIFLTDSTFQQGDAAGGGFTNASVGFTYTSENSTTTPSLRDPAELLTFHGDGNTGTSTSVNPTQNPTIAAVTEIASYLNTKWPGYQHTFVEKWSTVPPTADARGQREAQQVAWNIYGMAASASKETTNGVWSNQTPASSQPAPTPVRFAAMLWDGPKPDPTWPSSRILPQTRSPYLDKMAISFIATQYTRTNGGAFVSGPPTLKGTTKYVVNVRFAPQLYLPLGYQGNQLFDAAGNFQPWKATNDEVYITHFEATIDDGSGAGGQVVKWASEAKTYDGSLYWDPDGGTLLHKINGIGILSPDSRNFNFSPAQAAWDFSSKDNTVAPSSPAPPGYVARTISFIFDSGPTSRPCNISNVKIRFVVTTGTGSNITPYQISPMRDIDGANGFEAPNAQDSGAITFPPFQIPTTGIATNTPEYWMSMETLDPRLNQRGTPVAGPTATDYWQAALVTPSFITPASPSRNTRLAATYPTVGTSGDESKLAWLDASSYITGTPKIRWGMHPGHVNSRMPSIGLLSCLSTGMQSGEPWRTLRFQPTTDDPPDWLLLDLFATPFNRATFTGTNKYIDSAPPPLTYMNSTAGKININATLFPTSFGLLPSTRELPLKALIHNMYRPQVAAPSVTPPDETVLFNNIVTYLNTKSSHTFDYAGEICQVPGFSDSGNYEWEKETLVRNLASLMTTRSNAFSVYGVAQTVKKNPANNNASSQGIFETRVAGATADDTVTGEKRFRAIVERYVWSGVDATAGNAQTSAGSYSQLGTTAYLGSNTNTIDATDPTQSTFLQGYNPSAAVIKYKIVYFEYLN